MTRAANNQRQRSRVEVTHPDKPIFASEQITKADLVSYYESIASVALDHVRDRPATMQRLPEGIDSEGFMQQQMPDYFPDWIERVTVEKQRGTVTHVLLNSADTLGYVANQGCVTPHIWLSRADKLESPDRLIFDLDPPQSDFEPVRRAALSLRALLEELDLHPFVMSTGSRGLHVVCQLERRHSFDAVRGFSREVAHVLAGRYPDELTTEQRKQKRGGRLYLDTMRNAYGQHAVAPYSLRARRNAPVAAPLRWRELERGEVGPQSVTYFNVFDRLKRTGDPWQDLRKGAVTLSRAQKRLSELDG